MCKKQENTIKLFKNLLIYYIYHIIIFPIIWKLKRYLMDFLPFWSHAENSNLPFVRTLYASSTWTTASLKHNPQAQRRQSRKSSERQESKTGVGYTWCSPSWQVSNACCLHNAQNFCHCLWINLLLSIWRKKKKHIVGDSREGRLNYWNILHGLSKEGLV